MDALNSLRHRLSAEPPQQQMVNGVTQGDVGVAEAALQRGADPNIPRQTPTGPALALQEATVAGQLEIVQTLLRYRANPNSKNAHGMTALHWRCKKTNLQSHRRFWRVVQTPVNSILTGFLL